MLVGRLLTAFALLAQLLEFSATFDYSRSESFFVGTDEIDERIRRRRCWRDGRTRRSTLRTAEMLLIESRRIENAGPRNGAGLGGDRWRSTRQTDRRASA